MLSRLRNRVLSSATSPFGHAPYPLAGTLSYPGDPGLLGPDSVSWRVIGDVSAFSGGIRALLTQAAHAEVMAGVADHSRYADDPLGRLSRTSAYVTATTFGAIPEVEAAVRAVRRAHRPVEGSSERGREYSAANPAHGAWVHNVLTDSFLATYLAFGAEQLSAGEADRFVEEQRAVGALLDADPMPATAESLALWISGHPDLVATAGMAEVVRFLRNPPLGWALKVGYRMLYLGAVATMPRRVTRTLGIRQWPGGLLAGRLATRLLRWALGFSPSWNLALVRVGAPIPPGKFRQPLPTERTTSS